jgi:sugar phosphate isomerase/epimerase
MIKLYLSTIGKDAAVLARKHGFGIEIAEFSYAVNMDTDFTHWESITHANLFAITNRIFHAPYNELCPASVDPLIVEVTRQRLNQAYKLMQYFGINRMVVHSGYVPHLYFKDWFIERSVVFWRDFLIDKPDDFSLLLENVQEESPHMLCDLIKKTDDMRFQLCLDVGHAGGSSSNVPVTHWVETTAPYLGHVHIHNNYHASDLHNPPEEGLIDMCAVMTQIIELQPSATYTAETTDLQKAVSWFKNSGFL